MEVDRAADAGYANHGVIEKYRYPVDCLDQGTGKGVNRNVVSPSAGMVIAPRAQAAAPGPGTVGGGIVGTATGGIVGDGTGYLAGDQVADWLCY